MKKFSDPPEARYWELLLQRECILFCCGVICINPSASATGLSIFGACPKSVKLFAFVVKHPPAAMSPFISLIGPVSAHIQES